MTLKAMSYVSEMRSNLSLMRRSRQVSGRDYVAARDEVTSYLARRVLIYPPSMRLAGLKPDMSFIERKQALDISSSGMALSDREVEFQEFFETSARKARRAAWIWRIGSECEDMRDRGWFPFFVTLTVDPSRIADSEAMWREGKEFRRYIRRLAKVSASACGQPCAIKNGASDHDFVRHVGIIEHGKSCQHHHMHLLVWMRGVPASWKKCPNAGIRNAASRTINFCREMQRYWPHSLPGLGRALYFRHEGDIWSALGFCQPIDPKTGVARKVFPARLAGVYVSKYMEKGDRSWHHRVKATRDLGKGRLRNLLHALTTRTVEALTWRPRNYDLNLLTSTIHSVPSGLLRSMAKETLFCRQWACGSHDPRTLVQPSSAPYIEMLKSVRDGQRPSRMSSEEFFDWLTQFLPVPSGYCSKRLGAAHTRLIAEFPPCREQPVSHLGGMSSE